MYLYVRNVTARLGQNLRKFSKVKLSAGVVKEAVHLDH